LNFCKSDKIPIIRNKKEYKNNKLILNFSNKNNPAKINTPPDN
jgi:hypothetical protein